jgi:8-oxo-dGTP pyrophosphatase MutT (NUDIX family)
VSSPPPGVGKTVVVDRLRSLLLDPSEAVALRTHGHIDAAVLIALYADPRRGLVAVLTERHADLRKHAGEISFPGGRRDAGEELLTTALREAEEEIGLDRSEVDVVGALAPVTTLVTGFRVYPFVGVIEPGATWAPHEREVARVLELSLRDLAAGRQWRPLLSRGVPVPTVSFTVDGHLVWGATARMVDQLLRRLGPVATE